MGGAGVAAAYSFFGTLGTTTATGWAAFYAAVQAAAITFVVSKVASELQKEPDRGVSSGAGRTETVRQEAAPRQIVYGEVRKGGVITYMEMTDSNEYLHMVITLSGHEVEAIDEVYFDDEEVMTAGGALDSRYQGTRESGDVSVSGGEFSSTGAGALDLAAFAEDNIIEVTGMANAVNNGVHRVTGITVDTGTGVTTMSVETTLTDESATAATFTADFVAVNKHLGASNQAADADLIRLSDGKWTSNHRQRECANIYVRLRWNRDKWPTGIPNISVKMRGRNAVFDPRDSTNKYTDNVALCINDYLTWDRFGFNADYATEVDETELIAAANECDESVSLSGGGTESRYTLNGVISSGTEAAKNIDAMMSAMAGEVIWSGGTWFIQAGAYRTPTLELDENDLRGGITTTTGVSRRELFNAIKGTYVSPENDYIEAGFPAVRNSTYETADGEVIWRNVSLPFTDSPAMAQRLAKISLEQQRQQISVNYPCSLKALALRAGDTVNVTNSRLGWTTKPFDVVDWTFRVDTDGENPVLGIDLSLRETASAVYDWNSGEETTVDPAPDTNLPNALDVGAPRNVTLASGTDQLYRKRDGTVVSRLLVSWDAPNEGFVSEFEVQHKRSSESVWQVSARPESEDRELYIWDAEDDVDYDVRIRTINPFLVRSDWVTITDHTVIGKTAPPADVTSFSAQQNRELVTFKWSRVAESDIAGYEIRYKSPGLYSWDNANVVTKVTRGTLVTNAAIPPGNWIVGIKAIDSSGNYSTNDTTSTIEVINEFDLIENTVEHPDWLGVIETVADGVLETEAGDTITTESGDPIETERPTAVVHDVSGRLVPNSLSDASGNNFDVFDTFVLDPVDVMIYTSREIDIAFDEKVRIWGDIESALGPGETGSAEPDFYADYRTASGSYDGFEVWAIGTAEGQFFKGQLRLETATGVGYIDQFKTTVDLLERTERFDDFAVGVSGSTLTYRDPFHTRPNVSISASEGTYFPIFRNKTTTDVDIELYDASGTQVSGTVDVTVTGV